MLQNIFLMFMKLNLFHLVCARCGRTPVTYVNTIPRNRNLHIQGYPLNFVNITTGVGFDEQLFPCLISSNFRYYLISPMEFGKLSFHPP